MLKIFEVLNIKYPEICPKKTKIHLAIYNGTDDPLDVYISGEFKKWQEWQTGRNFKRDYIVSLVRLSEKDKWLFVGAYRSNGCNFIEDRHYDYKTEVISELEDLSGRLVVRFSRTGMQSYLYAENCHDRMIIDELYSKKMSVADFPGYKNTLVSKRILDIIINKNCKSWRSALSNVAGIYLITDTKTGKLYVGSATGSEGIWQRWSQYSKDGHGGNKELKKIVTSKGLDYADNFQYSILEIGDTYASQEDLIDRENYWKQVLCSLSHGNNKN